MIPYGRQSIEESDIAAVVATLHSDWLTQGPRVAAFEAAVAGWCGARYAYAVHCATSALHIACLALGLGPGKRLWTTPNTFVASANCGRYCGAQVDFVDIDPRSYCLSADALEIKLVVAAAAGALPDVLVGVDFAGQPCDWQRIADLCRRYGVRIIDDASHALGATYRERPVGCGDWADITVFSFHPVKILTSAEGGMALTNDPAIAARLEMLRNHGVVRSPERLEFPAEGAWYYEQQALGFNYRMSDVHAALGCSQMQRLPAFLQRRRALARRYDELLREFPVQRPWQDAAAQSSFHLYPILLADSRERRAVFDAMRADDIGVQVHYIPVHLQPDYRRLGFASGDFPTAEAYYQRTLTLPLHAGLSDAEQDYVVASLARALSVKSVRPSRAA